MNKEQVTGKLDEAKGKIKEKWGSATNDPETQGEGLGDQAKGKVEQAHGNIKETVKDALHDANKP